MELKDAVLSTLAEIEESYREEIEKEIVNDNGVVSLSKATKESDGAKGVDKGEFDIFLISLRERILVLFEGLLTIQNEGGSEILQIEKKLDLVINFLEYMIATIDEKLEKTQE